MNALKHGRRAALQIKVPGENSLAFLRRLELWRQGNEPRTQEEYYLLHQNVMTSFQLDAVQRAGFARRQRTNGQCRAVRAGCCA